MSKKYIPEGVWLACNKGTCPSTLSVTNNNNTYIYGSKLAGEADVVPNIHVKPMGLCTISHKICTPDISKWDDPQEGVMVNNLRLLKEDSTCTCKLGGKIKIYFDWKAAVADCAVFKIEKPTECTEKSTNIVTNFFNGVKDRIKDHFDSEAEVYKNSLDAIDSILPERIKPGVTPLLNVIRYGANLKVGVEEAAVSGIVAPIESESKKFFDDPIGYELNNITDPTGAKELANGLIDNLGSLKDKAQSVNWSNAWENVKNLTAADRDHRTAAIKGIGENIKNVGTWIANNPRKTGNLVGQFIPDIALIYATRGKSAPATEAKLEEELKLYLDTAASQTPKDAEELGAESAARSQDVRNERLGEVGDMLHDLHDLLNGYEQRNGEDECGKVDAQGEDTGNKVLEMPNLVHEVGKVVVLSAEELLQQFLSSYKFDSKGKLGDFGESLVADWLKQKGFDRFYHVQNNSRQGVDIIAKNSRTGAVKIIEVKSTQSESYRKDENDDEPRPIYLRGDQRVLGGYKYAIDRLTKASQRRDGYTDDTSPIEAAKALKAISQAKKLGKLDVEKYDVYVNKDNTVHAMVKRDWLPRP